MSLDADPLYNEKNLFYRGDFHAVVAQQDKPGMETLVLRAQIELDPSATLAQVTSAKDPLHKAAAGLCLAKLGRAAEADKAVVGLLTSAEPDVQILVATVLARLARYEEALDILGGLEEHLEAAALQVHLFLLQDQQAQAEQALASAQAWANDEDLIQLAEAWVMLRQGGDRYGAASYTFQELAEASDSAARMVTAGAAAECLAGHVEEAETLLKRALQRQEGEPDALANQVVLAQIQGRDAEAAREALRQADATHPLLRDMQEKQEMFESLATVYTYVEAA